MKAAFQQARNEGAVAATKRQPFQSNPYPLGTEYSRQWSKGYRSAEA